MKNKFKIIRCLLENEYATQPDLAVYCGYERDQVSNIQTDIRKLKDIAIITEVINAPPANQRGRPPKRYCLVKSVENIRTINRFAEQLSSDDAQIYSNVIRQTTWVQDKVIQELLDPSIGRTSAEEEEIRAMLALSPYFFETAIGGDSGIKIDINKVACFWSDYLHPERDRSPSASSYDYHWTGGIGLPLNAFQDLFAFCLFVDRSRGLDSDESWKFLESLSDKRRGEVRGTSGG